MSGDSLLLCPEAHLYPANDLYPGEPVKVLGTATDIDRQLTGARPELDRTTAAADLDITRAAPEAPTTQAAINDGVTGADIDKETTVASVEQDRSRAEPYG